MEVSLIDKPNDPSIFVSLDRVTPCYPELGDCSWTGRKRHKTKSKKPAQNTDESQSTGCETQTNNGHRPVTRSMTNQSKA